MKMTHFPVVISRLNGGRPRWAVLIVLLLALVALLPFALAQRGWRGRRTADRHDFPQWEVDSQFKNDVFTFVRIQYDSGSRRWGGGGWNRWDTDYPDSDLNFSFRLQQMTSLKVDPEGRILQLTDPELFNYPFIYIIEPGYMLLTDEEVVALRRYLFNGGFLMVDDFWGEEEWHNFYMEIKRVFPDREPIELPLSHPIFHSVFDLKEKPQVPAINGIWRYLEYGISYERSDAQEVHFKAFYDDNDRMVAIICHNTDLGDGWEREGENVDYFREFSEKKAYPMGINIVFYAMTH